MMLSITTLFLLGCAGGGNSPVTPGTQAQIGPSSPESDPGTRQLWGLWDCYMEPGGDTIEVVPLRSATFTANVNSLLEGSPGNLNILDLDLSQLIPDGLVSCTVQLKHPLPGLDQFHGFDVWGVFMHDGQSTLDYDGLTYSESPDEGAVLLNADGYTRWFNYSEFFGTTMPIFEFTPGALSSLPDPNATLNGYRIFADGLGIETDYHDWITTPGNADSRGMFSAGAVNSRRYEMQFPVIGGIPEARFQYAVVAGWEPGDPTLTGQPTVYDPLDFPTDANCDEAFFVHADPANSTLYYDGTSAGGSFIADIEVFDWQGGFVGGLGVPSEIERIVLEADFLPGGTYSYDATQLAAIAIPGTDNSSVFQVDISGCSPTAPGLTDFWVVVESAGMFGDSYDQGFPTTFPPNAHRAAFLRGSVDIAAIGPMGLDVISIDPDTVPFWSYVDDAIITGIDFEDGATVELRKTGEDPVPGTNVVWINSTTIQCDFDLAGVDSGIWDVVVINPDLEEGILDDGLTIDVWSEEWLIEEDGNRLPAMAETAPGSLVLVVGCNDGTMRYMPFDGEGAGWSGPYLLTNNGGNNIMLSLASDPVSDNVYLMSGAGPLCRYTGGTGTWEISWDPIGWCRTTAIGIDQDGRIHLLDNTSSAFGHIIHIRATGWNGSWDSNYLMDGMNINVLSEGNIVTRDSSGKIFFVYERDWWLNPYGQQQSGPRWVKVGWIPLGGLLQWNFAVIDTAYDMDPLDSPAITCDSDDILHVAYRRFVPSTDEWEVVYRRSTTSGTSWGSESIINIVEEEPEDGYVFLMVDSNDDLHAVYNLEGEINYKASTDGSSWSDAEVVNESATGDENDFTPRMLVTSTGIMHVAWIRDETSTEYGDIMHRIRDLY